MEVNRHCTYDRRFWIPFWAACVNAADHFWEIPPSPCKLSVDFIPFLPAFRISTLQLVKCSTIRFHSFLSLARSSLLLMFTSFSFSSFKTWLYHVVIGLPLGLGTTRINHINSFMACLHGLFSGRRNGFRDGSITKQSNSLFLNDFRSNFHSIFLSAI